MARLSLGLDSSTQSLTAIVIDIDSRSVVFEKTLNYRLDARLNVFGINEQYILPPGKQGEANQPVPMYFASLDAVFADIANEFTDHHLEINDIVVINTSGQQHGHVLLNKNSQKFFQKLWANDFSADDNLVNMLGGSLAIDFARIWRTSCTVEQSDFVRGKIGGKEKIIELTGSNAPLRFSAFGIRKTGQDYPQQYENTLIIPQISSLISAVLTGDPTVPLDFGNACGTSLMDYKKKQWSPALIDAVSQGLPGAEKGLAEKLPVLKSGKTLVGKISNYFIKKFGFNPNCAIGIGSGDNPQTKILIKGSLLSLGTSFVNMVETNGLTFDMEGSTNAMYDAFDHPFMFGCRTNGALRWDDIRQTFGMKKEDYVHSEKALNDTPPGNKGRMLLWQAEKESFPVSESFGPIRIGYDNKDFAADFVGIVESTLADVYLHSKSFMQNDDTLYVTGGATESPGIMAKVAAIWNRNIIPLEKGGAALGAAVSGAYMALCAEKTNVNDKEFASSFLKKRDPIKPNPEYVKIYHDADGFLKKYNDVKAEVIA